MHTSKTIKGKYLRYGIRSKNYQFKEKFWGENKQL